jgi:hypothetical protein
MSDRTPADELRAAATLLREDPELPEQFEVNLATGLWMALNAERLPLTLHEWLDSAAAQWDEIRGRWEAVHALAAARAVNRSTS